MSAVLSGALEHELKGLNDEIARVSNDAQAKKAQADALVTEYREAGINPLVDNDAAAKVEAAYLEADNLKNVLTELNRRRSTSLGQFAETVAPMIGGISRSVISRITEAAGFAEYAELAKGGGNMPTFSVDGVVDRDTLVANIQSGRGIFAAGADGASLIPIDQRLTPPVEILARQVRLLDLITVGATDSDLVRYGVQSVRTPAAAATAVGVAGVGTAYSQATYTWTTADVSVRSIGHYAKAPRENLADQGALQTLIEGQLSEDVLLAAETQIYSGDGTGQNFTGIKTAALAGTDYITRDETNERRISALHRAAVAVRLAFMEPSAIWIHPTDYHNLLVEQSSSGGFLLESASLAQTQPVLWGLPVVQSALATLGEPTVGAFKQGATLWVREGVSVRIAEQNEDDFIKRMVAILAEFRGGFAVQRANAFSRIKNFT